MLCSLGEEQDIKPLTGDTDARTTPMEFSQNMDISAAAAMCDIKPILPPYSSASGLGQVAFPGLNGSHLHDPSTANQVFLSAFAAQRGKDAEAYTSGCAAK